VSPSSPGQLEELGRALEALGVGGVRLREDMAARTRVRAGGMVDVYVEVSDETAMLRLVRFLAQRRVRFHVVGRARRVLVQDGGYAGVLVSTANLAGKKVVDAGAGLVVVGAGVEVESLIGWAGGMGFEVPVGAWGWGGSLGWLLCSPVGPPDARLASLVVGVEVVTPSGRRLSIPGEKLRDGAGTGSGLRGRVLLSATLKLRSRGRRKAVASEFPGAAVQCPPGPVVGPLFHDPDPGRNRLVGTAADLIARSGLGGVRVNGARLCEGAPNWIENVGGARVQDMVTLMRLARDRVKRDHGVTLAPAVQVVGRPAPRSVREPWKSAVRTGRSVGGAPEGIDAVA